MDREELEKEVYIKYGVAPMQVYKDNDKREPYRKIKVLGVALKPGKASCSACDIHGKCYGRTLWIKFERLNSKAYTRILTGR